MQMSGGKFGHGRMNVSAMAIGKKQPKNYIFPNFPQIKAFLQKVYCAISSLMVQNQFSIASFVYK